MNKVKINLTLLGSLNKYLGGVKTKDIELKEGAIAGDILTELNIPAEACSFIMVADTKVPKDYKLEQNDKVVVFPYVSGG